MIPPERADLELLPFRAHHLGNVRAMDIHVANADMPAFERKTHGEIRRAGALSHSTLVAHDEHFVFDPLHPLGDQPTAVPFLVLLAGFVFIADGAGPHVGAGIAAAWNRDVK